MSNKRNEDLEMRGLDKDFREKDPFLGRPASHRRMPSNAGVGNFLSKIDNSPGVSITAYCFASISMTVVNKYVVSGSYWNLNFLYLAIQVSSSFDPHPCLLSLRVVRGRHPESAS